MIDLSGHYLVIANETGKHRHPACLRRALTFRPQGIAGQVYFDPRPCFPTPVGLRSYGEHFIQKAPPRIDHDDMPVSVGCSTALDGNIRRNGIRSQIAVVVILEFHAYATRSCWDFGVWYPVLQIRTRSPYGPYAGVQYCRYTHPPAGLSAACLPVYSRHYPSETPGNCRCADHPPLTYSSRASTVEE